MTSLRKQWGMANRWTGGQYSLVRAISGVVLAGLVLDQIRIGPASQAIVAGVLLVLTLAFVVGYRIRLVTTLLGLGWLPIIAGQGDPRAWGDFGPWGLVIVLLVLVLHGLLAAPEGEPAYGTLDAAGRVDPAGRWRFPPWLFQVLWLTLGAFYLGAGVILLRDESWRLASALFYADGAGWVLPWVGTMPEPLGRGLTWLLLGSWLAFGPLAMARRNRRLAWALTLGVSLLVLPLAGYWALAAGLAMLHMLAFNPVWLPACRTMSPETVFYDGQCGLCHRWARFVLAEDREGTVFVLSPLDSEHFRRSVPAGVRETLPDSIVVQQADGQLLTRSAAVLYMLDRIGGLWRVVAWAGGVIPEGLRDVLYDRVAAVRYRFFAKPSETCPMMPPGMRERFRM